MPRTGTGRIYQRGVKGGDPWVPGRPFWIDYSFRGTRHREPVGSPKISDARKLLRKRMAEMGRGKVIGPDEERLTFEDLAKMIRDDYAVNGRKSTRRLGTSLTHLAAAFGLNRAIDITTDRVRAYIANRQAEGASSSSIQKELGVLKRAINLAVQVERLTRRPYIPGIAVSNTREGFAEAAELEKVIEQLPAPLRPAVRFAYLTGWRKSEVLNLQWSAVDWTAGVVRLAPGSTKNDEGREFPFKALPPLEALLKAQREQTRELERKSGTMIPHVFHRDGNLIASMDGAWRGACERAGLAGLLFHDLRRSAVRNLERAGVPRSVAMKLTGHKTEAVYRRYAIADSAALSEGVEKLARLHAEPRKVIPMKEWTNG